MAIIFDSKSPVPFYDSQIITSDTLWVQILKAVWKEFISLGKFQCQVMVPNRCQDMVPTTLRLLGSSYCLSLRQDSPFFSNPNFSATSPGVRPDFLALLTTDSHVQPYSDSVPGSARMEFPSEEGIS